MTDFGKRNPFLLNDNQLVIRKWADDFYRLNRYDLSGAISNICLICSVLTNAVFFANGGEMIFLTRDKQQIANACKNLIKNAIICWNYLYLTRRVQMDKTSQKKQELIKAAKLKTANVWRHIFFTGTYDFSPENSADSFNLLSSKNYELDLD